MVMDGHWADLSNFSDVEHCAIPQLRLRLTFGLRGQLYFHINDWIQVKFHVCVKIVITFKLIILLLSS